MLSEVVEAGGWNSYTGQILYYSIAGYKVYPEPLFAAALTDMSSEEGLSNITLRNARNNFLPAGMMIYRNSIANSDEQAENAKEELKEFQGDTNAGKMLAVNLEQGEDKPEFVNFSGINYDKNYTNAEERVPLRIGSAFRQPPVLRGMDGNNGFDTQRIKQAYNFYNSLTESERQILSASFAELCKHFMVKVNAEDDYTIAPKVYEVDSSLAERLGADTQKVIDLLKDTTLTEGMKTNILREIYGLEDNKIDRLLSYAD